MDNLIVQGKAKPMIVNNYEYVESEGGHMAYLEKLAGFPRMIDS